MYQQTLGLSEQIGRMREEIQKVKENDSKSLQKLDMLTPTPEPRKTTVNALVLGKEGVALLPTEIETDNTAVSVKVNQVVVINSPLSSEPPNADLQVKTLLEPKPPDMEVEMHIVKVDSPDFGQPAKVCSRREPPAKPPDRSVALDRGGYARADAERIQTNLLRPPPSPEPPDADRSATVLPRQALRHKPSYLNGGVDENLRVIAVDGEKVWRK
ncbi:hypothetical protein L195_g031431 [Trifolium pratense]|uniref:Uncharacterized protein n=2 Tax=Trifolium pratense TaxID=57577 RepID=A0A2K3LAE8_TRIPR|nr:hypothetical protein L195_g031431 [Trifolium pratense]CAJ2648748.1 unnamed protein product [Trifolium pratense]